MTMRPYNLHLPANHLDIVFLCIIPLEYPAGIQAPKCISLILNEEPVQNISDSPIGDSSIHSSFFDEESIRFESGKRTCCYSR
jgi:hypothetical protein